MGLIAPYVATSSGASTSGHFVYDGPSILAIVDDSGNLVKLFTNAPNVAEPLKMGGSGGEFFYFADGIGSVRALSDASGSILETVEYAAYGRAVVKDAVGNSYDRSQVGNPLLYAGTEYDNETGLHHMGHREQDPDSGRFNQQDPVGYAGGTNLFRYAMANPLRYVDPRGLFDVFAFGAVSSETPSVIRVGGEAIGLGGYESGRGFYTGDIFALGGAVGTQGTYYGAHAGKEILSNGTTDIRISNRSFAMLGYATTNGQSSTVGATSSSRP